MKKFLLLVTICLSTLQVHGDNVDLATLPERQGVELTIYNSEDLTLVREIRLVSFKAGSNTLQFSWANTLIDPTSVELNFIDAAAGLDVRDTTFPHQRPQSLYWHIESEEETLARVEISYFTSGIRWSADYTGIANAMQDHMEVQGFVRVDNHSGEDYPDASIRLVVGTINLVQQIADLARMPVSSVPAMPAPRKKELRFQAARSVMAQESDMALADYREEAKQIQKDGLSEYFIFRIPGRENVPDGWSRRLRSLHSENVPLQLVYRYREPEYGDQLVRVYRFPNRSEAGLGDGPLPDGRFQVLHRNAAGGLRQLASQAIPYVPIGDHVELNLGTDPLVSFELTPERIWRDNIWMRYGKGSTYRKLGSKRFEFDRNATVAGWDRHTRYRQRIRNNTGRSIAVEVRRSYQGDVVFRHDLQATSHDYRTVEFKASVAPDRQLEQGFEVVQREGRNRKQVRVELEQAPAGQG